jgi:hypothetical protein
VCLCLDLETLDLVLEGADLAHQVGGFVGGNRRRDDRTSNSTGAAKCHLGRHINVRDVLVLAKQRQVEEDGERRGVRSEDDQLADSAVQGLGGLVGALLELAVVGGLLDEIKNLLGESLVGFGVRSQCMSPMQFVHLGLTLRPGGRVVFGHYVMCVDW